MSLKRVFQWQVLVCIFLVESISSRRIIRDTTAPTTTTEKVETRYIKDIYPYGFTVAHPELCPDQGANLPLLILVSSAIPNKANRVGVRKTWGAYGGIRNITTAIVLGRIDGLNDSMKEEINAENALYKDMIIANFEDTYNNLTLKTLSMLEWAATYCSKVPKVMKVDDDVYLNMPNLISFIADPKRIKANNTIYGQALKNINVTRVVGQKYYVSMDQYRNESYPTYMNGPAYIMTSDAVKKLLQAMPNERYMTVEDALVTGIVANKLGIKREFAACFLHQHYEVPGDFQDVSNVCNVMNNIATHLGGRDLHRSLKKQILDAKVHARCLVYFEQLGSAVGKPVLPEACV